MSIQRTRLSCAGIVCAFATLILTLPGTTTGAQEAQRAKAQAPENHVILKDTQSGSYFVAKPLKEEYERLLSRLRVLKSDIEASRTSGPDASRELRSLQMELERLRKDIETKMVLVPIAKTKTQTETISFELGAERGLLITADNLRIVGWDQPGVKCELEKTVLSGDDKPAEDELKAIKVVHKHGRASDKVGMTREEFDVDEQRFLASADGQALTPKQREGRRKFIEEIHASKEIFREFQGKDIDTLEITGLTGQEGNSQMSLEVASGDDGASYRSVWRRHAKLTVYVPACQALAVRGGQVGLDIQDVQASLVLTGSGSHDRAYYGEFKVRGVGGSLVVKDSPLHVVEDVDGNVSITSTTDFANSGTTHEGGSEPGQELRTFHFFRPLACSYKNIRGDLTAWLSRVDLQLENVSGRIDVRNEFGDTKLVASGPLAKLAHRIVSEAGRIEVEAARDALGDLPLWAGTSCGTVRTNASRNLLEDFHVTVGRDPSGTQRGWSGFRSPRAATAQPDAGSFMDSIERCSRAYLGLDRAAGLDLISRGGTVVVNVQQ